MPSVRSSGTPDGREPADISDSYRQFIGNSDVAMGLVNPATGAFVVVNQALCDFFGYAAEELLHKTWMELSAEGYTQTDSDHLTDLDLGKRAHYRTVKQYIRADGRRIWGDAFVSCLRDADGRAEHRMVQIIDITRSKKAGKGHESRAERTRIPPEQMSADMAGAAEYVRAILPGDIDGAVPISSRYRPSQTIGGDCFDYRWFDEDHLVFYLLDVSGHGLESALVAISVHNMLRTEAETMLRPDRVLDELNRRYQMDSHHGLYLTIWYGIYQRSTRTLTYAAAGHPPALIFSDGPIVRLEAQSQPVGMFADTEFRCDSYPVPPRSRILLYSDGTFDLSLPDGDFSNFRTSPICARNSSPISTGAQRNCSSTI